MNRVVARIDKIKSTTGAAKMAQHITRDFPNEYVDQERSHLNYSLKEGRGSSSEIMDALQGRLSTVNKTIRKDAVRAVQFTISGSPEQMKKLSGKQQKQYFKDSLKVVEKIMGKENILSADVHMDEKTPHMHILTTPVTKDERLHFKSFINGRDSLVRFQDKFGDIGKKYGFNRGVRGSRAKHQNLKEYNQRIERSYNMEEKKWYQSNEKYQTKVHEEVIVSLQAENGHLKEELQYMRSFFNAGDINQLYELNFDSRDRIMRDVKETAHKEKVERAKSARIEREQRQIRMEKALENSRKQSLKRDRDGHGLGW